MLHILLMILKIIGIVLLVILGLLLAAVLLILLVPVRYGLQGEYRDSPVGSVRVTWLLHAFSALITYDGRPDVSVKILGFQIFHLNDGEEPEEDAETEWIPALESEGSGSEWSGSAGEGSGAEETAGEAAVPVKNADETETAEAADEAETAEAADEAETAEGDLDEPDVLEKIEYLFSSVCDKLDVINKKWTKLTRLWENPNTQHTVSLLIRQIKKIILHVIPRRAKGNVLIGFEDPSVTGRVLAACSLLYAWYGDDITVTPDFEHAVMEGDLDLKGRVRAGTLALCAARVLVDRKVWATYKKIKKIQANGGI